MNRLYHGDVATWPLDALGREILNMLGFGGMVEAHERLVGKRWTSVILWTIGLAVWLAAIVLIIQFVKMTWSLGLSPVLEWLGISSSSINVLSAAWSFGALAVVVFAYSVVMKAYTNQQVIAHGRKAMQELREVVKEGRDVAQSVSEAKALVGEASALAAEARSFIRAAEEKYPDLK